VIRLFTAALAMGFAVGLVRNQLAAVYALAEYVAPLSIMGCAAIAKGNERILDRWIKSVGWAAVTVSLTAGINTTQSPRGMPSGCGRWVLKDILAS